VGTLTIWTLRISERQRESGYQWRLCAPRTGWCRAMTTFALLGLAAILSTAIVTAVPALAIIRGPGAYAFLHRGVRVVPVSTVSQRRETGVVDRETANVTASALLPRSVMAANETKTRPWSAPVGHRQPRAIYVPTSTSASQLNQEDAKVDYIIGGVGRGC
jgi:hypothetical protein